MARVKRLVLLTLVVWSCAATTWAAKVSDWVNAVETTASATGKLPAGSRARVELDRAKLTLADADVMNEEISQFVTRYARPDLVAVARRSQRRFELDVTYAVTSIKGVFDLIPGASLNDEP